MLPDCENFLCTHSRTGKQSAIVYFRVIVVSVDVVVIVIYVVAIAVVVSVVVNVISFFQRLSFFCISINSNAILTRDSAFSVTNFLFGFEEFYIGIR